MKARRKLWGLLAAVYLVELALFAGAGRWLLGELPTPELRVPVLAFLLGGGLALAAALALVWTVLDSVLVRPLQALARNAEIMARTDSVHQPNLPVQHLLGELPHALQQLGSALHRARTEVTQALGQGAAKAESQKLRLEAVISDLDMGVVVCDGSGRIVLYFPADLRILGSSSNVGLGRSV